MLISQKKIRKFSAALLFLAAARHANSWAPSPPRRPKLPQKPTTKMQQSIKGPAEWAVTGMIAASLLFTPLPVLADAVVAPPPTIKQATTTTVATPTPAKTSETKPPPAATTAPKPAEASKAAAPATPKPAEAPKAAAPAPPKPAEAPKAVAPAPAKPAESKTEAPKAAAAPAAPKPAEPKKEAPKAASTPAPANGKPAEPKKDVPKPAAAPAAKASTDNKPKTAEKKKQVSTTNKTDVNKKSNNNAFGFVIAAAAALGIGVVATGGGNNDYFGDRSNNGRRYYDSGVSRSMLDTSTGGYNSREPVNYRPGTEAERIAEERKREMATRRRPTRTNYSRGGSYARPRPNSPGLKSPSAYYDDARFENTRQEFRAVSYRAGTERERLAEERKRAMEVRARLNRRDNGAGYTSRSSRIADYGSFSDTDRFDGRDTRNNSYRAGSEQERIREERRRAMAARAREASRKGGPLRYDYDYDESYSSNDEYERTDSRFVEEDWRTDDRRGSMAARNSDTGYSSTGGIDRNGARFAEDERRRTAMSARNLNTGYSGTGGLDRNGARFAEDERRKEEQRRASATRRSDTTNRDSNVNQSSGSGFNAFNSKEPINYRTGGTPGERMAEEEKRRMASVRPAGIDGGNQMSGGMGPNNGNRDPNMNEMDGGRMAGGMRGQQRPNNGSSDPSMSRSGGAVLSGTPGFNDFNSRGQINYKASTERERLAEERKREMAAGQRGSPSSSSASTADSYGSRGFNEFNSREPINYKAGTAGEKMIEERKREMGTAKSSDTNRAGQMNSGGGSILSGTPGFNDFNSRGQVNYKAGTAAEQMAEQRKKDMGERGLGSNSAGPRGSPSTGFIDSFNSTPQQNTYSNPQQQDMNNDGGTSQGGPPGF